MQTPPEQGTLVLLPAEPPELAHRGAPHTLEPVG
jgi:hypothetical protein